MYTKFVNLTKAFDTVSHEGLWKIMSKFGSLEKFINIVCQFHDGMFAWILDSGQCSHVFLITSEVKQGCVLAPMLFSMIFSVVLSNAFNENEHDFKVNCCTDGKFFNLKRLQTKTKVEGVLIHGFLFADDCALSAASEADMLQNMINSLLPVLILA